MTAWHDIDVAAAIARLQTDLAAGLDDPAAAARLARDGPNELASRHVRGAGSILLEQFATTMVVVLAVAAVGSFAAGDVKDAVAILSIVVLNAALGFAQDYRTERALAALTRLSVPLVGVRRSGQVQKISARLLVAGDVILLEPGNIVGADARLVESTNLQVEEASLTGEAEPVHKDSAATLDTSTALADRRNMVFMGTAVTYGRAVAVVIATGMRTELGQIAALVQNVAHEPTPLQRRLDRLGRGLAAGALAIAAFIFLTGLARGEPLKTMFLTAISLAVAAVPEGLPAVVTIALALGSQRMLRRHALVRRLSAVEGLGSVDVICTDKTGTLTQNRMSVAAIELADRPVDLADAVDTRDAPIVALLAGAALCNDASIDADDHGIGDPTEVALLRCAAGRGLAAADLAPQVPRVAEAPFDSVRKRMSTVHRADDDHAQLVQVLHQARNGGDGSARFVVFTKGAPDRLLAVSDRAWTSAGIVRLDAAAAARATAAVDRLAARGMRVLGVGVRWIASPAPADAVSLERDLIFLGLLALADPSRPEASPAVAACKAAGIRPVMITGDHPLTAQSIAKDVGITDGGRVVTGTELDSLSDDALAALVDDVVVFARVSPEHKLRLVNAYAQRGHVVAMTGDGVNDAPALKRASIGIAMGVTGTDVAKEVADIVLLDDNFASIVSAVEEGRVIYDNLRKFVKYLLTTNSGELLVMALGPLLGLPLPLLPLQILWINLVTDGPTALMLGIEPAEPDVMRRPPARQDDRILSPALVRHVASVGLLMAAVCLAPGYWYYRAGDPAWQTVVFTVVALAQMAHVLSVRSNTAVLSRIALLSNLPLISTVAASVALQFALVYTPTAQRIFGTVPLAASHVAVSVAFASAVFVAGEADKWLARRATG
jgi:Ca2+-transporting ATPase